jgi:hypothetical protein
VVTPLGTAVPAELRILIETLLNVPMDVVVKLIFIAGERPVVNVGAVPFQAAVAEALAGETNVETARTRPSRVAPRAFKEKFFIPGV